MPTGISVTDKLIIDGKTDAKNVSVLGWFPFSERGAASMLFPQLALEN